MTQPCSCPHHSAYHLCIPISQDSVRDALDVLVYSAVPRPPSPLIHLTLIDEVVTDPNLPCSPEAREFLLAHLLTTLIGEQLGLHRRCFGLEEAETSITQRDAIAAITAQAQTGSIELLGWGWLYYRCVRVDLAITPTIFSQAAGIDLRTLRRYQHHAIGRLILHLLKEEYAARQRHYSKRVGEAE